MIFRKNADIDVQDLKQKLELIPQMEYNIRKLENRLRHQQVQIHALNHYIDYLLLHPVYDSSENLGFNSQDGRKQIFKDLMQAFDFARILETGTWVGSTTGYMVTQTGIAVHSCDANERYNVIAKQRLENVDNIHLSLLDSREFLTQLAADKVFCAEPTFIYLDAHWHQDLPLAEELDIIASNWSDYVIMIDDFAVPGDDDYKFDDYGPGKILNMDTFGENMARHSMTAYFPALAGADETGAQRGCVVLSGQPSNIDKLDAIPTLRRAT